MKGSEKRKTTDAKVVARALVDLRDNVIQKARIQFNNRLLAIQKGKDQSPYQKTIEYWYKKFSELEEELNDSMEDLANDFPIVEYMCQVKGVGKKLAIKTVAMIDIERAQTISQLWRYAGYAVIDGKVEKPVKGEKLHYNTRLKKTCYLIGESFIKQNSPYRRIYDEAKEYYQINRPEWTKLRCHRAAMRKMTKIWLAHLWVVWRKLEGLPVTEPWIAGKDGHQHILQPEDFGWNVNITKNTATRYK